MRIVFIKTNDRFDAPVADAFSSGLRIFAHKAEVLGPDDLDKAIGATVLAIVGVRALKRDFREIKKAGGRIVFIDKGHMGRGEYVRTSVDTFMPTRYLMDMKCPPDRFAKLGIEIKSMRSDGRHIIYAGSSHKYSECRGLGGATEYAQKVLGELMRLSPRAIVYRPKPSWQEATPIEGTFFSRPPRGLSDELRGAHCLVTHGSNSAVEALLAGIPTIVLGDGVALPLSKASVQDVEDLYIPTDEERHKWASNLAYCQWSLSELRSGEAWENLSEQLRQF